jgi:hypothetical protein
MSLAEKLVTPEYYTATVDHSSIAGFNVYQHVDGHDPKLVAKRRVTDRFWKYITNN